MADAAQALHTFWSSFGLTAYDENSVPTGTASPSFPYLTYQSYVGDIHNTVAFSVSLWYRSTSWAAVVNKAEEIRKKLVGVNVPFDGGSVRLWSGSPGYYRMSDPNDDSIRRIVVNIEADFISL